MGTRIAFEGIEGRKATEASIGVLELAKVEGRVLPFGGHGESVAKNTYMSRYRVGTSWANSGIGTWKCFRMENQPAPKIGRMADSVSAAPKEDACYIILLCLPLAP